MERIKNPITADLKSKWIAALRSEKYTQGNNILKNVTGQTKHCCLGVLCEISEDIKWVDDTFYVDGKSIISNLVIFDHHDVYCYHIDLYYQSQLIYLNDREQKSFSEIADWIETNVQVDICS